MKEKIISTLEQWASWKNVLVFFALQMLFNFVILPGASGSNEHDLPVLDLQFFYTPEKAYEILSAYTPAMRQASAYGRLTADMVYPLVYGFMLSFLIILTFGRAFANKRITDAAILIPWSGVLGDYIENIALSILYLQYPTELTPVAWIASIATLLKWTLIGISFLLALIGGVKLVLKRLRTSDIRR